jgi:hypothetical protein
MLMHLTSREHNVFGIVGIGEVRLAVMATCDKSISLLQLELPTGDVGAQVHLAHLQ